MKEEKEREDEKRKGGADNLCP
jgi:hypothetical protein